ncbi:MAG: D-alanyl-D-alanine carboxypeptidase [Peptococcaceae bacterium]|nr:D-alanyl-D-alanine carboxypeptidase [Peptococcaceae bacterium]
MKKLFWAFAVLWWGFLSPAAVWAQPEISAEAAVLMDMQSGQILYQRNMNQRMFPASTTKILTTLVAIKKGNFGDRVKVSREACLAGGSHVGLQEDEVLKFEDLLYIIMLSSANDAAVAVAEHIGGSVEGFARLMNSEARAIGALNSNFVNPHGLHDPDHYTTAGDLALIAREAMKNSVFREIAGTYQYRVQRVLPRPVKGVPQEDFVNHNKMLWPGSRFKYEGATGIKTGFTDEAGQCLVASASRNGRELLAVVLNTQNYGMYIDTAALLDYGFSRFKQVTLAEEGDVAGKAVVQKGVTEEIGAVAAERFSCNIPVDDQSAIEKRVIIDGDIVAPVQKGQKVGTMYFVKDGRQIGGIDLLADRDVDRRPLVRWWYGSAALLPLYLFIRYQAKARRRRYMFRKQRWY